MWCVFYSTSCRVVYALVEKRDTIFLLYLSSLANGSTEKNARMAGINNQKNESEREGIYLGKELGTGCKHHVCEGPHHQSL